MDLSSAINTGTYGTVSHMPPELIVDGRLSPATDVFSFGVVGICAHQAQVAGSP